MRRIDAHLHVNADHPEILGVLEKFDLKILNICVAGYKTNTWRTTYQEPFAKLAKADPSRFAWCASFDLPDYASTDREYADKVIELLKRDLADGAIACKVWKNIGMELKDKAGRFAMVDDATFEPIFAWLERNGTPLLMHIAEPYACWQPLGPTNLHSEYYGKNPQWHMHGRTDVPSHAQLMAARDRVIERHPKLKVIGAHFGSQEYSLKEVAQRFDRYPNYAVDTSGRLEDAAHHDREELRDFIIKYQDRVLWGTDLVRADKHNEVPPERVENNRNWMTRTYTDEFRFYGTGDDMQVEGFATKGLALPEKVQENFFGKTAKRWYPGL